jgi:ubiquinone/menaquinone biosynthesis C-methylase UbiE
VSRYDKKEDAMAKNEVALLQKFGLTRESEIIDMGAGTGQFTLQAASVCKRVIAVDVSSLMLKELTSKIEKTEIKNIEVIQAGFLTYNHLGDPADFVYSRLVLHHLPDFWKAIALKRIHSFMRPGGIFRLVDVVFDFNPEETESRLEAFCARLGNKIEEEWVREELEEHIRDEHSTFRWLFDPMIKRCEFEIEDVEYSPDGFLGKYILRAL